MTHNNHLRKNLELFDTLCDHSLNYWNCIYEKSLCSRYERIAS